MKMEKKEYQKMLTISINNSNPDDKSLFETLNEFCKANSLNRSAWVKSVLQQTLKEINSNGMAKSQ